MMESKKEKAQWPFSQMVTMPWPYLLIVPISYILLCGFGWAQDDYVEEEVNNIWTPKSGSYYGDKEYARGYGKDIISSSSMLGMAIARDGGNLFTESRLEEIRQRMERLEAVTLQWKDETITWEDMCGLNSVGSGTTYEFPCARLSPMDLFQEARWSFNENDRVTWHNEVVGKGLVKPIIPRFGIMSQYCPAQCAHRIGLRTSAAYAVLSGYDESYAQRISLLGDIASMEMNDPCKRCIEENFESQLDLLTAATKGSFGLFAFEIQALLLGGTVTDPAEILALQTRAGQYAALSRETTRVQIEEFFLYYTTRGLYAQFNLETYMNSYSTLVDLLLPGCLADTSNDLKCPDATVTVAEAIAAMTNHADGPFSSHNTAGTPFPWWSLADGTGKLFEGEMGVSGSGIDLSGDLLGMAEYLDLPNFQTPAWNPKYRGAGGFPADTTDPLWLADVEDDPIYKWFMAVYEPDDSKCVNNPLTGTETASAAYDGLTAAVMGGASQSWCTKYNVPNTENSGEEGSYNKQYFSKMWYDLFIDTFLDLEQGVDDPYTWTLGQGCGYELQGERDAYTNQNDSTILSHASRELYYVDEGTSLGPVDRHLLMGDVTPNIDDYSMENPLEEVGVIQTIYFAGNPDGLVKKVKNCNRPNGQIDDMTYEEAKEILEEFKKKMETEWSQGWDDDESGEVQFVFFSDDAGAVGSTGQVLRDMTLNNSTLVSISTIIIALFSVIFLISPDWIESRVLITLIGVALVVLAFFASLGFAILLGTKINVSMAWTLPFIIVGIGVDDVYIVLMTLKNHGGYGERDFMQSMKELAVPVTMTSMVNCLMFAVMNISDIPAVYETGRVAVYSVIALYLSVLFCFPAYCWLDMKRQAKGYRDVFFCLKASEKDQEKTQHGKNSRQVWLYDKFYHPLLLGSSSSSRNISHAFVILGSLAMFGTGIYGITQYEVGVGLEDLFPTGTQVHRWAVERTESLASWPIVTNWGQINYTDPITQQKMIKQFEDVVNTTFVSEIDTKRLWMSDFLIWSTRHCVENFDRDDPNDRVCGMDQVYEEEGAETLCSGSWMENTLGLRNKYIGDGTGDCEPFEGGHCRSVSDMFPEDLESAGHNFATDSNDTSYCPFVEWSDEKFLWCMTTWRNKTNFAGGGFVFESNDATPTQCSGEFYRDEKLMWPIPYSTTPNMFAYGLFTHELTLDLLEQTRAFCDDDEDLHCWMQGIPYDYWSQYTTAMNVLIELTTVSTAVGFFVAWMFLFVKIVSEKRHALSKVFWGTLGAACFIALTIIIGLVAVIGLSVLADVNVTGFSNVSFVLSVAFSVEYSVHVVSRWLRAPNSIVSSVNRVEYTMEFLMLPTFMSWISSTIGVVCLAFTEFEFIEVFFFRPLMIMMMVTYFIGCYALPALLCHVDHEYFRLGKLQTEEDLVEKDLVEKEDTGDDIEEIEKVIEEKGGDQDEKEATIDSPVESDEMEKIEEKKGGEQFEEDATNDPAVEFDAQISETKGDGQ